VGQNVLAVVTKPINEVNVWDKKKLCVRSGNGKYMIRKFEFITHYNQVWDKKKKQIPENSVAIGHQM